MPLEFPVMSLGEAQIQPTAMLLRNLMAMDVEESIRGNPIDGVVLLAGCDKTTPAMVMGAASVDLPAIMLTGGPMLTGRHDGRRARLGDRHVADERGGARRHAQRGGVPRDRVGDDPQRRALQPDGHGVDDGVDGRGARPDVARQRGDPRPRRPPPASRPPHRATHRRRWCATTSDPSAVLTRPAFENAIRVLAAIGGSTNAVIHLLAIAGRVGVELTLDDFDRIGSRLPLLANVMPAGEYLMEDFFEAGGIPAVMAELADLLDGDAHDGDRASRSVSTGPGASTWNREVIRPLDRPADRRGGSGRAARQPLSAGRGGEAVSGVARRCSCTPVRRSCSTRSRTSRPASTTPTWTSLPTR